MKDAQNTTLDFDEMLEIDGTGLLGLMLRDRVVAQVSTVRLAFCPLYLVTRSAKCGCIVFRSLSKQTNNIGN
jgi:hypothetical protein